MSEEGRGKRLGGLDWCILGLITACLVGGAVWYFGRGLGERGDRRTVYYTVRIYDVDRTLWETERFGGGDAVFSENGTLCLGSVTEITTAPQRVAGVQNGEVVIAESPRFISVDVRIRGECVVKAGEGVRCRRHEGAARECFGSFFHFAACVFFAWRDRKAWGDRLGCLRGERGDHACTGRGKRCRTF